MKTAIVSPFLADRINESAPAAVGRPGRLNRTTMSLSEVYNADQGAIADNDGDAGACSFNGQATSISSSAAILPWIIARHPPLALENLPAPIRIVIA